MLKVSISITYFHQGIYKVSIRFTCSSNTSITFPSSLQSTPTTSIPPHSLAPPKTVGQHTYTHTTKQTNPKSTTHHISAFTLLTSLPTPKNITPLHPISSLNKVSNFSKNPIPLHKLTTTTIRRPPTRESFHHLLTD